MVVVYIIFGVSAFIIFYAMIGYPALLYIINLVKKPARNKADLDYEPSVTYMIVAHNEEKVIEGKLNNAITIDYPRDKFEILVASDNSTDRTNEIVDAFIKQHQDFVIKLYKSKDHKGKTNAQNEAQKNVKSEILVMSDANSLLKPNAIKELISYFSSDDIAYVCGKLVYSNSDNDTANSESTYWNLDLTLRDIESRLQTITAGNGAIYACRNSEYIDFEPISCHDGAMPLAYALRRKRALFNPNAIAVEKAGENNRDEFKRKVRMNRGILITLRRAYKTANIFKYRWFSVFYFGHRTCRYSLWLAHIVLFVSSIFIALGGSVLGAIITAVQLLAFIAAYIAVKLSLKNRLIRLIGYYGMTVCAQVCGVVKILTGKASATWEKAESTR